MKSSEKRIKRPGFVTVVDRSYVGLARVLAESIERFSQYRLEVCGLGFVPRISGQKVSARRIEADVSHPHHAKYEAVLSCDLSPCMFLDADCIATPNIDRVFQYADRIDGYPLLVRHPNDRGLDESLKSYGGSLRDYLGVNQKTTPYLQSCAFLFDGSCRCFFEDVRRIVRDLDKEVIHPISYDENVLNGCLWKRAATDFIPEPCVPTYEYAGLESAYQWYQEYYLPAKSTAFLLHGEKDKFRSSIILEIVTVSKNETMDEVVKGISHRSKPLSLKLKEALKKIKGSVLEMRWGAKRRVKKGLKRITLALFAVLISLGIAECVLSALFPQRGATMWLCRHPRYGSFNRADFSQDYPYSNGVSISVHINSLGLRDNGYDVASVSREASTNVLLMGDSTTFGYGLNVEDTFGYLLQQMLRKRMGRNINVINAGVGGWGTMQQIEHAKDHLDEFCPWVIILTFCGNDPIDDDRFIGGSSTVEASSLPDFPGKEFLKKHSHLYRFAFYQWHLLRYGEGAPRVRIGVRPPIEISPEQWERTRLAIVSFNETYRSRVPNGTLIVQAENPWRREMLNNLRPLESSPGIIVVDANKKMKQLPLMERYLAYDGHWSGQVHAIVANELFDVLLSLETE